MDQKIIFKGVIYERHPANQLRLVVQPMIYKAFIHPNGGDFNLIFEKYALKMVNLLQVRDEN